MSSVALLFHTVRYLRPRQIFGRISARFARTKVPFAGAPAVSDWAFAWSSPAYLSPSFSGAQTFSALGESRTIASTTDWNNAEWPKLWLYNLHYFDDLTATEAAQRTALQAAWVDRWIAENPVGVGNGWEPYPLSLRIVNWVKWMSANADLTVARLDSLAMQTRVLGRKLEYHLLGNHLFANAKALIFAGAFFSGPEADRWLEKGLSILSEQIPEQFLRDGAHFELSPMYHGLMLWDLVDMLNLAERAQRPALSAKALEWREYVVRALHWLDTMCHPDGQIGFFNDAAMGIAPTPTQIHAYAAQAAGVEVDKVERPPHGAVALTSCRESGYTRIDWSDATALIDVARVGPDYLPGHAHADTLSFEFSLGTQRVFVNSGTSQYGMDAERQRQRGTPAHTTVTINNANSSQVWAGFRVAQRAYPVDYREDAQGDRANVSCAHTGYRWLAGKPRHHRAWQAAQGALDIQDRIDGQFRTATAQFHLHPDVGVVANGEGARLTLPDGGHVDITFEGGTHAVVPSTWHPRFGEAVPTQCLSVTLAASTLRTRVRW